MMTGRRKVSLALVLAVLVIGMSIVSAGLVILVRFLFLPPTLHPEQLFETYVLKPIPPSVTDIKVDQCLDFRGLLHHDR